MGLNYHDHAAEGSQELPTAPVLFGKFANTLCGDGEAILLPSEIGHVDAEAELAVVVGRQARGISADDALGYVAGYMCANDVSARDAQFADGQWFRGKGFDTFCPVGPELVEIDDPSDLRIVQRLNGSVLQESRTSLLVFDVPTLISYITRGITLEPGDLILTGTPAGVGFFHDPKISLQRGDTVEIEIQGIGTLTNTVR